MKLELNKLSKTIHSVTTAAALSALAFSAYAETGDAPVNEQPAAEVVTPAKPEKPAFNPSKEQLEGIKVLTAKVNELKAEQAKAEESNEQAGKDLEALLLAISQNPEVNSLYEYYNSLSDAEKAAYEQANTSVTEGQFKSELEVNGKKVAGQGLYDLRARKVSLDQAKAKQQAAQEALKAQVKSSVALFEKVAALFNEESGVKFETVTDKGAAFKKSVEELKTATEQYELTSLVNSASADTNTSVETLFKSVDPSFAGSEPATEATEATAGENTEASDTATSDTAVSDTAGNSNSSADSAATGTADNPGAGNPAGSTTDSSAGADSGASAGSGSSAGSGANPDPNPDPNASGSTPPAGGDGGSSGLPSENGAGNVSSGTDGNTDGAGGAGDSAVQEGGSQGASGTEPPAADEGAGAGTSQPSTADPQNGTAAGGEDASGGTGASNGEAGGAGGEDSGAGAGSTPTSTTPTSSGADGGGSEGVEPTGVSLAGVILADGESSATTTSTDSANVDSALKLVETLLEENKADAKAVETLTNLKTQLTALKEALTAAGTNATETNAALKAAQESFVAYAKELGIATDEDTASAVLTALTKESSSTSLLAALVAQQQAEALFNQLAAEQVLFAKVASAELLNQRNTLRNVRGEAQGFFASFFYDNNTKNKLETSYPALTLGADYQITPDFKVGGFLTYSSAKFSVPNLEDYKDSSVGVSGFVDYAYHNYFVTLLAGYSHHSFGVASEVDADESYSSYSLALRGGYDFDLAAKGKVSLAGLYQYHHSGYAKLATHVFGVEGDYVYQVNNVDFSAGLGVYYQVHNKDLVKPTSYTQVVSSNLYDFSNLYKKSGVGVELSVGAKTKLDDASSFGVKASYFRDPVGGRSVNLNFDYRFKF